MPVSRRNGRCAAEACANEVAQALRDNPAALLGGMYGDQPDRWSSQLEGIERHRFTINCLTRLRFVDGDGRLLPRLKGQVAEAPHGAIPWFRHPRRRTQEDRLVFGHWSALGYLSEPGLRALDAGCVWGGSLCAIRLDVEEPPVMLSCRGSRRRRRVSCSAPARCRRAGHRSALRTAG